MKTKCLSIASIIVAMFSLSLNSCKKDNSTTTSSNSANEQAAATMSASATSTELMYDDAFDVVNQSSEQSNLTVNSVTSVTTNSVSTNITLATYTTIAGATITLLPADPSVFPKTMTIDFGAGVTDANGITRKGQIIVALSGKIRVAGSTISVTFNNYSVNSYQLTGTYAITPDIAAGGGVNYNITVSSGSITFPSGQVSTYSGTETFTQVAGIGTTSITDDTYNITSSFSFSSTTSGSITGTVTTPLIKSADCKDITTGVISFVYKGLNGTLDFGAGTCDNQATVKVGLITNTITLPR